MFAAGFDQLGEHLPFAVDAGGGRAIAAEAVLQFLAEQRGDAGERADDEFFVRHVGGRSPQLLEFAERNVERIGLVLLRGRDIGASGQHFAVAGGAEVDVHERVEDAVVGWVVQDDVGVAAHDLNDQHFLRQVAKFVAVFDVKMQDALVADLLDAGDLPALAVFA